MAMDAVSSPRPGPEAVPTTAGSTNERPGSGQPLGAQGPTVPTWRSIVARIEDAILTGVLAPRSVMPGEIELARRCDTSRATAAHALDYLASRGLVKRIQGKGTFVAVPQAYPDVSLVATHEVEFTAVGGHDRRDREFAGVAVGRIVARLAVAAGGFWQPTAADLTVASLLGPPAVAGRSRFLTIRAGERAEFEGTMLRASISVRDEFQGRTAKVVSLLHPGFFSLAWNVNSRM